MRRPSRLCALGASAILFQPLTPYGRGVYRGSEAAVIAARFMKAMHRHYTGTQVDVKVLRPAQHGLRAVGHFNFFHAKTGPRGWALSLPWLGLTPV